MTIMFPSVAAVVLNWNDAGATSACLRSLAATRYPNLAVIVVDNASTDGSAEALARDPSIDLLRNPANLGFTGGVNTGIRRAMENGADYVWLLNSDAVTGPDVLGQLVAAAERDERIGLVSPVFHDPAAPDRPEWCLSRFDPASRVASQTADPGEARAWADRYPGQLVLIGTALLIRRALVTAIGGLDEQFFAYVEDVDYSLRAAAAGFRAVVVPEAVVLHGFKRPVETPGAVPAYLHYFMTRNYLLLWRKRPGRVVLSRAMLWFLRQRLSQIARMRDDPAAVNAVLAGLWDGLRGIGGRYDPARRMPAPPRWLLGRFPSFWIHLIDGRLSFRPITPR
jgi:GT2 family glycosyltransferase